MNPPGYCGRGRGYGRASSLRSTQSRPGRCAAASGQRHSFAQGEDRGYGQRPLSQRDSQHYPGQHYPGQHYPRHRRTPEQDDINKIFRLLRTNPGDALDAAEVLWGRHRAHPSLCINVSLLKARALFALNKIDDCIAFINALETRVRNDKGLLMAKARAFQAKGHFHEALPLFQHLYVNHQLSYKDHKAHGLALGRLLQLMGGADNLEKALAIFTRLRTRTTDGRINTPCNDKHIELALGRHLQLMGGVDNLEKSLAIYTRLRGLAAGGQDTACDDKEIELALGRLLQVMGGANNMKKALAIYTRLRAWAAGGRDNTPCHDTEIELSLGRLLELRGCADNLERAWTIFTQLRARAAGGLVNTPCDNKDIELSLGRLLQHKGGEQNLEQALAIYTRLRTRAAGGREDTPCDDRDIELTLASFFTEKGNWTAFDALRLEARRFSGIEPHLCLSVRYWRELLDTRSLAPAHSKLLGKAICSGVLAVEKSGFVNASCISQLAHCIRLLSCWPDALLKERGLQHKDVRRLRTAAKFLFDTADMLAPCRQRMEKDQHWRAREQELRALLSRQQAARGL